MSRNSLISIWKFFEDKLFNVSTRKRNETEATTMFVILMAEQISLSPEVKQSVIISNKLVYKSCEPHPQSNF